MGFFDTLGNMFGFGDTEGRDAFTYNVQTPQFVSKQYLDSLEQQAQAAQSRPETSSFAEALLKKSQDEQLAQANALAASSRGGVSPALLQRQVMRQQSEVGQRAAAEAGTIRAKESLENRKLNDELAFKYRQLGLSASEAQARATLEAQRIGAGLAGQITQAQQQNIGALISGGASVAAAGAGGMAHGGVVPGQAEVEGDHEVNDKVPAMLSPGEIVIPRSKAKDSEKAKEFIDHIKGEKPKKVDNFSSVLSAQRQIEQRLAELEKIIGHREE